MRTTEKFNFGDYKQLIVLEGKKIVDANCTCIHGKNNEDAYKEGETLCKHVQGVIMHLRLKVKKYGFDAQDRLVEVKKMLGYSKLPSWLRLAYLKSVDFTCEDCHNIFTEAELDVHRIIQGYKNGTYRPGNVKILCKEDHRKYAEDW